ncbi:MAG: hypothetical protein KDA89_14020, partial [Planctomycetaceae bacterium]|nr:hypothetical protein [Planctomycetaceae bacterium]
AIVSNRAGCAADMITEGQTGWTFPFGDWDSLSGTFLKVCEQAGHLPHMASACRSQAASHGPEAAANGIAAAVEYLLK